MKKKSEYIFDEATRIAGVYRAGEGKFPGDEPLAFEAEARAPVAHSINAEPTLPSDNAARKTYPMCTGLLDYFPNACAEVAHVSYIGNEQHNPGEPLHWARGKSMDQEDCIVRHLTQRGKRDADGTRHSAKLAWRALALLQLEIEKDRGDA